MESADLDETTTDHIGHSCFVLVEGLRAQDSRGIKCLIECGEDVGEHRLSTGCNGICSGLQRHAHKRMEARGMQNA